MNHIIIELSAEDRKLLTEIRDALQAGHNCKDCVDAVTEAMDAMSVPEIAPQTNEKAEKEQEPTEPEKVAEIKETEPEQPAVKREDIQRKVVELSAAGKKVQVRDIVKAYAVKVSDIPADKLVEVWNKLSELEG